MRLETFSRAIAVLSCVACGGRAQPPDQTLDGGNSSGGETDGSPAGDAGDSPVTIATGIEPPLRMLSDGNTLFWLDATSWYLYSVSVQGSAPTLLSGTPHVPRTLSLDDSYIYAIQNIAPSADGLVAIAKAGGRVSTVSDGSGQVRAAWVRGASAFWIEEQAGTPAATLKQAPNGGGSASAIAQFMPASVQAMAVTESRVFVVVSTALERFSLGSGAPDGGFLSAPIGICGTLLADQTAAYCVPRGSGPVFRADADGAAVSLGKAADPQGAAIDSSYVYWAEAAPPNAGVMRVPKKGGATDMVTTEPAVGVAVDDAAVYWVTKDGRLRRLLK